MIAMTVFAIASLSITAALLYAHRSSITAVYETTAHSVAQGYVEQIMALEFEVLYEAYEGRNETPPTPLVLKALSPSQNAASSVEMDDLVDFSGDEIIKNVIIDLKEENGVIREVIMEMKIKMTGNDLTTASSPLAALEIKIDYEYQVPVKRGGWSSNQICFVKSNVPIY